MKLRSRTESIVAAQKAVGRNIEGRRLFIGKSRVAVARELGFEVDWLKRIERYGQDLPFYLIRRLNKSLEIDPSDPLYLLDQHPEELALIPEKDDDPSSQKPGVSEATPGF